MSAGVDVLLPTCNRPGALAATLASLAGQTVPSMHIIISDQSDGAGALARPEVAAALRVLIVLGHRVSASRHLPRRGMAEQRAYLLSRANAHYCLFLDDDVLLENDLVERLLSLLRAQRCGFVGSALHGLSHAGDVRPQQQAIEFWDTPVRPELVTPTSPAWQRHHLHSAANLFHVQSKLGLTRATTRCYRVAWVGGCVLYDTAKLRAVGGFDFWPQLPPEHCGEDVLAQLRVMARYGGCGMIPSGAYHMELPTTLAARGCDAPLVLWPPPPANATQGGAVRKAGPA
jgi:hypothetical protein